MISIPDSHELNYNLEVDSNEHPLTSRRLVSRGEHGIRIEGDLKNALTIGLNDLQKRVRLLKEAQSKQ